MIQEKDIKFYFSGATMEGFQTFPRGFNFAKRSDINNSKLEHITRVDYPSSEIGKVMYSFVQYNFKTAKGGRRGSNLGIWLVIDGSEVIQDNDFNLHHFFDRTFTFLQSNNLITQDGDGSFYFMFENFLEREEVLASIIDKLTHNFLVDFGDKTIPLYAGRTSRIIHEKLFLQKFSTPQQSFNSGSQGGSSTEVSSDYTQVVDVNNNQNPDNNSADPDAPPPKRKKYNTYKIIAAVLSVLFVSTIVFGILFGEEIVGFFNDSTPSEISHTEDSASNAEDVITEKGEELIKINEAIEDANKVLESSSSNEADIKKAQTALANAEIKKKKIEKDIDVANSELKSLRSLIAGLKEEQVRIQQENLAARKSKTSSSGTGTKKKKSGDAWKGDALIRHVPNENGTIHKYYLNINHFYNKHKDGNNAFHVKEFKEFQDKLVNDILNSSISNHYSWDKKVIKINLHKDKTYERISNKIVAETFDKVNPKFFLKWLIIDQDASSNEYNWIKIHEVK